MYVLTVITQDDVMDKIMVVSGVCEYATLMELVRMFASEKKKHVFSLFFVHANYP